MRRVRSWLLGLAICAASAAIVGASPALAQSVEPIAAPGLVTFLPAGHVVADGKTKTRLYVLALLPSGAPMVDFAPRLSVSDGTVSGWKALGGGVYVFDYLPPPATDSTAVTVSLKARTADKVKIARSFTFDVTPPLAHGVDVTITPGALVVGQDLGADVKVRLAGSTGQPLDGAAVRLRTSEGEVKALKSNDDGTFSARYVPKKVNYPHVALITAADTRQPADAYGYTVVRLSGKVDYPILATAGAQVTLQIASKSFGPVTAGADGKAAVPVVVPPGVDSGKVTTVLNGKTTTSALDLRVPETRHIVLFPLPAAIPADPTHAVPVRALVTTAGGEPNPDAKVVFTVGAGKVSAARHLGNGVFQAMWTPPAMPASKVSVGVGIEGSDVQQDSAAVDFVAPLPAQVALVADPPVLGDGATDLAVVATPHAPDGSVQQDVPLTFVGGGAKMTGDPVVGSDGTVRAQFTVNPSGPIEILARPLAAVSGNPMRHLVILAAKDRLVNDGASGTPVAVVTTDGFGEPVPGVPVSLDVVGAGGKVTPSVTTDAHGVGLVLFTAGRQAGVANVRARSGSFTASAAILEVPPDIPPVTLPKVGSPGQVAVATAWAAALPLIRVEHGGEVGSGYSVAAAPKPAAKPAPAPPAPTPAPGVHEPWVRVRAGFVTASYAYEQVPNGSGGPLLSQVFAIGGAYGGKNATPQGFELDARGWLPQLPYLGLQVHYRAAYYGVTASIFGSQVAHDGLNDLSIEALGRYYMDIDGYRFHVAGRLGFRLGDFLYFSQSTTNQQVVYRYDTLLVPALALGAELGGQVGRLFFVVGGGGQLAYGGNPYAWDFDATAGFDLVDGLYASIGFEALRRKIDLVGSQTGVVRGQLSDGLALGTVGVGWSF